MLDILADWVQNCSQSKRTEWPEKQNARMPKTRGIPPQFAASVCAPETKSPAQYITLRHSSHVEYTCILQDTSLHSLWVPSFPLPVRADITAAADCAHMHSIDR